MRLDWWKEGLLLKVRIRPAGLMLALLYAVAYWATRQLSLDQFYLPAGIRVAAVLLCPPRLWPYLLLGEYAYFAQSRVPMIEKYGLTWVIVASAFLMPAVMLIVKLQRRLMAESQTIGLLLIAAASSVVVTLLNLSFSHLLWPTPPSTPFLTSAARYSVGDFIGILTVAPIAMLWARQDLGQEWNAGRKTPMLAALSSMLLIGIAATQLPADWVALKATLLLLLALPAAALTCLYGWKGAALAVPVLNMVIGLTTPNTHPTAFDPAAFITQQIMAISGIVLLLLGSRITHFYHRYRLREMGERDAIHLARSSQLASEMELRERALHLRKLGDGIDTSLVELADWLKAQGHHAVASSLLHTSNVHSRLLREQTSMVYPSGLEHLGLYVALQAGGIRESWTLTERVLRPDLKGDPCNLSVELQLAAYRTLIDAVSILLKHEGGQIRIRARCGGMGSRRGILMVVSLLESRRRLSQQTTMAAFERLTGRTLPYDGTVDCYRNRVRILFLDRETKLETQPSAPSRYSCPAPSALQ
ncbi:MASE1 domain-containing protein [Stenotrophomonas sp. BSUC-16]|mgnify:FL=1|uniref:MASE1 domain-containing protein n=1 Tax=Stenotrophomonas TaxID=40323 RepID=UPI00092F1114|nr:MULTISPECIES: MASE1 domain-containing protein [Stenotrophomonas maltophilia group]MBA0271235.1 hypothetical protein [Stenotrophomonas maltophilia]MCO5736153.1 MASE1 domain-containing protein [Stenotrophomonas maltophilia]MDT3488970.1 MASE1 domain-containing protein [Stenotrophomonas maltophilia group sp. msm4]PSD27591.1 hypothetical protein C7E18_07490 [Stenotrophomonas maltophilia]UXB37444.1 MASE1 domain-containing protein [Stenotrophomonas maltophilia]